MGLQSRTVAIQGVRQVLLLLLEEILEVAVLDEALKGAGTEEAMSLLMMRIWKMRVAVGRMVGLRHLVVDLVVVVLEAEATAMAEDVVGREVAGRVDEVVMEAGEEAEDPDVEKGSSHEHAMPVDNLLFLFLYWPPDQPFGFTCRLLEIFPTGLVFLVIPSSTDPGSKGQSCSGAS